MKIFYTIYILIIFIFNFDFSYSFTLSENIIKLKRIIGNKEKIDSLFNSSFLQKTVLPTFINKIYIEILSSVDSEFIQNYQKEYKIDKSNILQLEIIILKDKDIKKNKFYGLLFSRDSFTEWKIVDILGGSINFLDSNYCVKYLEAYESVIEELNNSDFIEGNIDRLIQVIYGIDAKVDKRDPIVLDSIKKEVQNFYIWGDDYIVNRDERYIRIGCRNFNSKYIQVVMTLNWFNNWKIRYIHLFDSHI